MLTRTREVIARICRDGTVSGRDGSTHQVFPVAISSAEGEALRGWVKREGAASTVEVGLAYGISALFMCEGLLENGLTLCHLVIDPYQETRFGGCGLELLAEAGLRDVIDYRPESSEVILPRLLSEGRRFDLAFVDGNHRFEGVFLDLTYLGRLVRAGGVIFVDDYQLPAVQRAVSFFIKNLGWAVEEVSSRDPLHCWAVLRTPAVPKLRGFDYFVDF